MVDPKTNEMRVKAKPFQSRFLHSTAQFPAFIAGWGTGKTLFLILRALIYSQEIPNNLGVIFRKEFDDLKDSTIRDFEEYTQIKVNSYRNAELANGSTIMFRHTEELNNLQNINLGWFAFEQAEELENDKAFFMLLGRLRRKVQPSKSFQKLGLSERSGFVIANAGSDWMRKLWKDEEKKGEGFDLSEATTWDNADVLPDDFLARMKIVETERPAIYQRYVMNDWNVGDEEYILISREEIESLKGVHPNEPGIKSLISCDPAYGGDECVIDVWENSNIIQSKYLYLKDPMKIAGEIMVLSKRYETNDIAIDIIGARGLAGRLRELGMNIIEINSAEKACDPKRHANLRCEIWDYAAMQVMNRAVCYPEDQETRRQLVGVKYNPKALGSRGFIKLEPKQETKKRLGCSPDRADAWVYGIWALQKVVAKDIMQQSSRHKNRVKSYMAA